MLMVLQIDLASPIVAQLLAVLIFVLTYFYIATGRREHAIAALAGVGGMWVSGLMTEEEMLGFLDVDTLGLLFGMMIVAGGLTRAGFFRLVGIYLANLVQCRPFRMFVVLTATTALLSAFLDNVTTVLFMIVVTIEIMKILKLNPVPYIIGEVLAANIGGTATLIGDPPNIMIAKVSQLSFLDFILNTGPPAVIGLIAVILYFHFRLGKELRREVSVREIPLKPEEIIADRRLFTIGAIILSAMIVLFFIHEMLGVAPSTIALGGAIVLLFLGGPNMPGVLEDVDWNTLLFIGSLFVVVGGLVKTGVIQEMSVQLSGVIGTNEALIVSGIMWMSSFASAFVDNIPFTAAFIPLLQDLANMTGTTSVALWWALSLGAGFGGNGTIIASSATIAAMGVSRKHGYRITFKEFFRIGMPIMIISTLIGNFVLVAFMALGLYA